MKLYYFKDKTTAFQKGFPFLNSDYPVIVIAGDAGNYAEFAPKKKELEEVIALINQSTRKLGAQESFVAGIKNTEGF